MLAQKKNITGYRKADTIRINIKQNRRSDGALLLHSTIELEPNLYRLTERLKHWASVTPQQIFIGRKNEAGDWETLTYSETFSRVKAISQALLQRNVSSDRPIAILSENSIGHALLALASLHIGVPYSSITPAYSLRSNDFEKLRYVINLLTPGLIFVQDGKKYERALMAVANEVEVVSVFNHVHLNDHNSASFQSLLNTKPTSRVDDAFNAIKPGTIAKV